MPKPLDGIKILDMTRVLAGPLLHHDVRGHGGRCREDRAPGSRDDTRGYGPPLSMVRALYFMSINRSKRSLTLNSSILKPSQHCNGSSKRLDVLSSKIFALAPWKPLALAGDSAAAQSASHFLLDFGVWPYRAEIRPARL